MSKYICPIPCNFSSDDKTDYTRHLNSKKHKRNTGQIPSKEKEDEFYKSFKKVESNNSFCLDCNKLITTEDHKTTCPVRLMQQQLYVTEKQFLKDTIKFLEDKIKLLESSGKDTLSAKNQVIEILENTKTPVKKVSNIEKYNNLPESLEEISESDSKYKDFYKDIRISKFKNKNVIYVGYIGVHNGKHTFKFGRTNRIYKRYNVEHKKTFKTFIMVHIEETDNNDEIENLFKDELVTRNLKRHLKINNKRHTELFALTDEKELPPVLQLLSDLIKDHQLPSIKKFQHKYKTLKKEIKKNK